MDTSAEARIIASFTSSPPCSSSSRAGDVVLRHGVSRGLAGWCVAAAALALTACGTSGTTPSAAQETAYAESAPPVGEPVEFYLYTHCGVESLRLDGRWWHAEEPLYGEHGPGSAPEGWDDPYQEGSLTFESAQRVVFEAEGTRVEFVPAPDDRPMRLCR